MGTKTHTFTEKGTTKYSISEYPVSTTVSPVTINPVYVTDTSSPVAAAIVSIKTGTPYETPAPGVATSTGSYTSVSPTQFTGTAGRIGAGFAAVFVGVAAVALL